MIQLWDILKASKVLPTGDFYTDLVGAKIAKKGSAYQELEGVPPLTFTSNGQPLVDWTIWGNTGGVGVRTENLFDKNVYLVGGTQNPNYATNFRHLIQLKPNTMYTMSSNVPFVQGNNHLYIYTKGFTSNPFVTIYANNPATVTTDENGYLYFEYAKRTYYYQLLDGTYYVMLTEGSTAPSEYIPYGYKIPVTCGGTTTNIYIGDNPLGEGETVTFAETGVEIPTVSGENTLTVDTTVQPEKVMIKYEIM